MLEQGKISASEFEIMVITFKIGSSILVFPALLAAASKQDAWISSLIAIVFACVFIFVFNSVASLYPSMNYIECNEKILGKWFGKCTSLLFLYYVFHVAAGLTREIGDFFSVHILAETPIEVIMIMVLLTCLIGARLGLEVMFRTVVVFFPWIVMLLVLLFIFLIPEFTIENIQPIYAVGIKPILMGTYYNLAHPLHFLFFLMILPYVTDQKKAKKGFYRGAIIGMLVITLIIVYCIFILGASYTAIQTYPTYRLGERISIGDFIARIEVIVAIIWIFTIYFKLTITLYALALGLAQVFELKSYKILLFPLAFMIYASSIFFFQNIVHFQKYFTLGYPPFSLTICFLLPALLLIIGKLRSKHNKSPTNQIEKNSNL